MKKNGQEVAQGVAMLTLEYLIENLTLKQKKRFIKYLLVKNYEKD